MYGLSLSVKRNMGSDQVNKCPPPKKKPPQVKRMKLAKDLCSFTVEKKKKMGGRGDQFENIEKKIVAKMKLLDEKVFPHFSPV